MKKLHHVLAVAAMLLLVVALLITSFQLAIYGDPGYGFYEREYEKYHVAESLDMEMGELDGMETARRLRAADAGLQLVFVTGYADRVFDGYSVGALGYLLKPPTAEQLEEVLDRAQAALVRDLDRAYICRSGDIRYRIPIANILYFVSDRRQVTCVTEGRDYTFYGKLDGVAEEVGDGFVRIHQRYLVRSGAVDRIEGSEVVLRDGQRLPVSRSCQQSALLALTRAELEG